MKHIKIPVLCLALVLLLSALSPAAAALDDPQADNSYAVVLLAERDAGETVLYTRNENEVLAPASQGQRGRPDVPL